MSIISSVWNKIKEVFRRMVQPKSVEQVLNLTPAISSDMANAIELWGDMYEGNSPWLHEPTFEDPSAIRSLGLPQLIASEKACTALLEFESEITTPMEEEEVDNPNYQPPGMDELGNPIFSSEPKTIIEEKPKSSTDRATYLNKQYKKLKKQLRRQVEYGIAKGGLVIKPYIVNNTPQERDTDLETTAKRDTVRASIEFDFVQADGFFPLAFDGSGNVTEAAFVQRKVDKDTVYSRLEHHKYSNGVVTVENRAFKSNVSSSELSSSGSENDLGTEISLKDVPEWAELKPKTKIANVDRLMFAYFKMPEANTIDTYSSLGVSGYSRAVDLIEEADKQYSRLLWEYEGGELAIDIDRDALRTVEDHQGSYHSVMNHLQQRLFRFIDISQTGDTYQPYAPTLRDTAYIQGLNTILMRIEDVTGLSRGTISDASSEARTATELKILKQRSYQTNADIQQAIEATLEDVVYIMDAYCDLYKITPKGEYEVSYEWDDSILVDVNEELTKRMSLMQNGLASKLEVRMWYFGETEKQAREALQKIDEENQQAMEQNMEQQMQMASRQSPTFTGE